MVAGLQKRRLVEKRKKESVQVENKLIQEARRHDACSYEGQGNAVHTAARGKVT
jgi:hypothetical protein